MKKHLLACALALCMAFLCACGGNSGGGSPVPGESAPAEPPAAPPAAEEECPEENLPDEAVEPEPIPEPIPEPPPEPEKLEGLIFLTSFSGQTGGYEIYCFNPETGSESLVSRFTLWTSSDEYSPSSYRLRGIVDRTAFSSDYGKMACTKYFTNNGETHAGWLDTEGNFFDVTEALGLQSKSDFDDPVPYWAAGFQDGFFGYVQRPER